MKSTLFLTGALIAGVAAFAAAPANADPLYTSTKVTTTTPTIVTKEGTVQKVFTAVGTRKVGLVGSRPYPIEASRVESTQVKTGPDGVITQSEASRMTTQVSDPISFSTGGGTYYTEKGVQYYNDPSLNISVRNTGSFNN